MGSLQSLRNQAEEGPSPNDPRCIVSEKVYDCDNKSNFEERKVIVTRKKKENIFFHKTQKCHFQKKNI